MDTGETKKAKRKRGKAWNEYYYTKDPQKLGKLKAKRNAAAVSIRNAQRDSEKKVAGNVEDDLKSYWKYVRQKIKSRTTLGDLREEIGRMATTDKNLKR